MKIFDCPRDQTGFKQALESTLVTLNQYAANIDVLVQHQPHITALVWGSIRILFQVRTPVERRLPSINRIKGRGARNRNVRRHRPVCGKNRQ